MIYSTIKESLTVSEMQPSSRLRIGYEISSAVFRVHVAERFAIFSIVPFQLVKYKTVVKLAFRFQGLVFAKVIYVGVTCKTRCNGPLKHIFACCSDW